MSKDDIAFNRWYDENGKTMLLNSQKPLIVAVKDICREAWLASKKKDTVTKIDWGEECGSVIV